MKKLFWGFFFVYLNFNLNLNAHSINLLQSHSCCSQCFLHYLIDLLNMFSRCDLRYHTTIQFMNLDLR